MSNSKIIPRTPEEKVSRRCPTPTRICWNSGPVTKIKMKHYIHSLQCYSPHLRFNLLQSHLNWNQISWMTCYRVKRWRHRNLLFLCLHRKSYKHCSISKWEKSCEKESTTSFKSKGLCVKYHLLPKMTQIQPKMNNNMTHCVSFIYLGFWNAEAECKNGQWPLWPKLSTLVSSLYIIIIIIMITPTVEWWTSDCLAWPYNCLILLPLSAFIKVVTLADDQSIKVYTQLCI